MVQTKVLGKQKIPPPEIQNRLGLSYNYPVDKLLEQTALYPMERLISIYKKLLDTDISIKTGKWKDEFALDLLLTELCILS
jgi:DNA polymerase III delta subunit